MFSERLTNINEIFRKNVIYEQKSLKYGLPSVKKIILWKCSLPLQVETCYLTTLPQSC